MPGGVAVVIGMFDELMRAMRARESVRRRNMFFNVGFERAM